jgi:type IV pilus assembly protein PilC
LAARSENKTQETSGDSRSRDEDLEVWAKTVRCSGLELAVSTRILAVMLYSGVHISESLKTVSEQCSEPKLVEVWWTVHQHVNNGHRLSSALKRFPRVFSANYHTLVSVGEKSGSLPQCLRRIADWLEQELKLAQRIQASMTYPVLVLSFSCLLSWWLMAQVLPPFLSVLAGMKVALPWPTKILVFVVNTLNSVWGIAGFALALFGCIRFWYWLKRPDVHEKVTDLAYRVPLFGTLVLYTSNIRAAVAGSILFYTGCDAMTAWRTALQASGNPVMARHADGLIRHISRGDQASDYFESHPVHFAGVFWQMVRAGEETGRTPRFLEHLAKLLEDEVEFRVSAMTAALEPILMALLSLLMLGILLAVFLPLYSHLSSL